MWPEPYEGVGRSEWFVNVGDNPSLDPGVGVFGQVVRHMGVVDAIHALPIYDFPPFLEDVPMIGDVAALLSRTVASAFRIGIQLAAPFLVFGLLFNLGLGVLSRLMPQMQVFFVGMPLSILLGFLILLLVVGAMMMTFIDYVEVVLRELAPRS